MSTNLHFDLHFHPLFKQLLCKWQDAYPGQRLPDELESEIDLQSYILNKLDDQFIHILHSQASLHQMRQGNLVLGLANIVALEFGIAASRKGLFGKILQSNLTRPLDLSYFRNISASSISYYHLFLQELSLFRALDQAGRLTLLSRARPLPEPGADKGIFLALAMEGSHNLCRDFVAKKGFLELGPRPDDADPFFRDFSRKAPEHEGDRRLSPSAESLARLHRALWSEKLDLLYITLTHLTQIDQQLVANHAFGMKILQHETFYPQGFGLEDEGRDVVTEAYGLRADDQPTPVLIDIKHMSLKSRADFYQFRKEKGYTLPILATHMGVTGYSNAEWMAAKESIACASPHGVSVVQLLTTPQLAGRQGSVVTTNYHFNPWTINLMDDDIREVLASNGLIGMSLDLRILGFHTRVAPVINGRAAEYLSKQEAKFFFGAFDCGEPLPDDEEEDTDEVEQEAFIVSGKDKRQPLWLCFNIIHILAVAKRMELKAHAWKYLAIGSDFDGLIDPVSLTRTSALRPELEDAMIRWLPVAESSYNDEHQSGTLLPGPGGAARSMKDEPDMDALRELVRDILYNNGHRFIQNWHNRKPGAVVQ